MVKQTETISFPQDAASHPNSNVEWWYCYAILSGNRGNTYAVMGSFFRVGELAVPKGHYMIHSIIKLNEKYTEAESAMDRMLLYQMAGLYIPAYLLKNPIDKSMWSLYKQLLKGTLPEPHRIITPASIQSHPTRISYGNNWMTFNDDHRTNFRLQLVSEIYRIRLDFSPLKPVSLIDEAGKVNGLRYYSVTRNLVYGELYSDDGVELLRGEGWFDHQWGRSYGLLQGEGWDWFGLQLQDGNELLINRLRRTDTDAESYSVAKLIRWDGSVTTSEQVSLQPLRYWNSPLTSANYPIEWNISLPEFSLELHVIPHLDDQEMPIIGPLQAIWEGVCAVEGEIRLLSGGYVQVKGHGFVELVGYPQLANKDAG